jgi:hypothetical protein
VASCDDLRNSSNSQEVAVLDGLRKKLDERRQSKRHDEFERAATESDPAATQSDTTELGDDRRARDLPDTLGDFNETIRMGPLTGGGNSGN